MTSEARQQAAREAIEAAEDIIMSVSVFGTSAEARAASNARESVVAAIRAHFNLPQKTEDK